MALATPAAEPDPGAASDVPVPAVGQATCIDFTYVSGGRASGIFIVSPAASPGTWKQNGTTQNCAVASLVRVDE